ncbi:hypothetical protein EYF80_045901 [Liparis tanakae]|uniref:Uncharacterized protein n=1 Tax=Liparis tanakae TaxID=230148 RepID=A0A4Z2FRX5_9TELE|nr:hypothetical protein EYF80_045901 [Liparis tanakae]
MLTGKARSQLMPRLLKNTPAPSDLTVSVMQWRKPFRALITSMGVANVQPTIPEAPPASITPLQPGGDSLIKGIHTGFFLNHSQSVAYVRKYVANDIESLSMSGSTPL